MNSFIVLALCCILTAWAAPSEKEITLTDAESEFFEKEMELQDFKEFKELMDGRDLQLTARASGSVSSAEKSGLLDAHNNARRIVSPSASNMLKMKWNNQLADLAQQYANKCIWGHNADRSKGAYGGYVGENLYMTTGAFSPSSVVESWDSEKEDYNFNTKACSGVCGHYTQVVWAGSDEVGCGATRCSSVQGLSGWSNALIVVCNYGPGGNYNGQSPFKTGSACSACPSGTSCDNGLCSAGGSSGTGSSTGSSGSGSNTDDCTYDTGNTGDSGSSGTIVVAPPEAACDDESAHCGYWEGKGYCAPESKYTVYVNDKCPKSCGQC